MSLRNSLIGCLALLGLFVISLSLTALRDARQTVNFVQEKTVSVRDRVLLQQIGADLGKEMMAGYAAYLSPDVLDVGALEALTASDQERFAEFSAKLEDIDASAMRAGASEVLLQYQDLRARMRDQLADPKFLRSTDFGKEWLVATEALLHRFLKLGQDHFTPYESNDPAVSTYLGALVAV